MRSEPQPLDPPPAIRPPVEIFDEVTRALRSRQASPDTSHRAKASRAEQVEGVRGALLAARMVVTDTSGGPRDRLSPFEREIYRAALSNVVVLAVEALQAEDARP
jgi:hypothetical protein